MSYNSFTEYIKTVEPSKREKAYAWRTAIGLQAVDGMDDIIHHLAKFVSQLWQIHIFGEGNTRMTVVFFIKYLRTLGFTVENDMFAEHSWYLIDLGI